MGLLMEKEREEKKERERVRWTKGRLERWLNGNGSATAQWLEEKKKLTEKKNEECLFKNDVLGSSFNLKIPVQTKSNPLAFRLISSAAADIVYNW